MTDLPDHQFDSSDEVRRLKKRIEFLEVRINTGGNGRSNVVVADEEDNRIESRKNATPIANPSPLGLIAFGVVSWLSGIVKIAEIAIVRGKPDNVLAFTGIFVGGVGQLLAGSIHYAKNNMHSATTFSFFGLHWIIQGILLYGQGSGMFSNTGKESVTTTYFVLLAFVTLLLWAPACRMNRVLCTTLVMVILVFLLDAVHAAFNLRAAEVAAGVFSCIAGSGAFYMCAADLVNEIWQRPVIPVFPHDSHKDDYIGVTPYTPRLHFHKSITSAPHV